MSDYVFNLFKRVKWILYRTIDLLDECRPKHIGMQIIKDISLFQLSSCYNLQKECYEEGAGFFFTNPRTIQLCFSKISVKIRSPWSCPCCWWCSFAVKTYVCIILCMCVVQVVIVCLFTRSLRAETHLGPDGTRLEQNAQAGL